MNKLNILFIASMRNVGLSFNLTRLAISLKELGHKVVVVSEPGEEEEGLQEELKRKEMKYYRLRGLDFLSVKNTVTAARIMGRIIDHYNVDVIHAQGIRQLLTAFLSSKSFCRKKVCIVASTHTTLAGSPYENAVLLIESFLLNVCADLALPVAKSVANKLVRFGLIQNKAVPIYNGIDLKLLDEIMCSNEFLSSLPSDFKRSSVVIVGYFGRLVSNKGHGYVIKAISEVSKSFPNIRLVLAGDGPLKGRLEDLSRHLGIEKKVLFTGKIGHKAIYEILKKIDIYAFPSLAELFPFAILEAMAAGKPIVATNVGGVAEVIKNGETGILVPPGDHVELAEGIKKLVNNPTMAKKMGERCRKLIEEKFTLQRIANDLTKYYELTVRRKLS